MQNVSNVAIRKKKHAANLINTVYAYIYDLNGIACSFASRITNEICRNAFGTSCI